MASIEHQVGIAVPLERVYTALTQDNELSRWWTSDTRGAGEVESIIQFRFNGGGPDFRVSALQPNESVEWTFSGGGPEAWSGTIISFRLKPGKGQTLVRFRHSSWKEADDFFAHCSTKWAVFLLSLKELLETGTGKPFPNDTQIDHG